MSSTRCTCIRLNKTGPVLVTDRDCKATHEEDTDGRTHRHD